MIKNLSADSGDIRGAGRPPPGVGNGNPLQYPRLENPWTEDPGRLESIALQSRTRLNRLSTGQSEDKNT